MEAVTEETATKGPENLEKKSTDLATMANSMVITNDVEFTAAGEMVVQIQKVRRAIEETFDPIIADAHKAHKTALGKKAQHDKPLEDALKALGALMGSYKEEKDREAAKLAAQAEGEQKRLAEDARLEEAEALQGQGREEEAEAVLSAPVMTAPVRLATAPKVDGVSFRKVWKAEVVDLMKLVKAVAAGEAPLSYLAADMKAINGVAKALKKDAQIPGIRVFYENSTAVGV